MGGRPFYYYGQIRVHPTNPERVFVLGVRMSHTFDGGKTWRTDGAPASMSTTTRCGSIRKIPTTCCSETTGGLCRSYDDGKTWDVYDNLPLAQFYAVGVDDRDPYWIYGGLQDNGSHGTPSAGATRRGIPTHETRRIFGGDGFLLCRRSREPGPRLLRVAVRRARARRRRDGAPGSHPTAAGPRENRRSVGTG